MVFSFLSRLRLIIIFFSFVSSAVRYISGRSCVCALVSFAARTSKLASRPAVSGAEHHFHLIIIIVVLLFDVPFFPFARPHNLCTRTMCKSYLSCRRLQRELLLAPKDHQTIQKLSYWTTSNQVEHNNEASRWVVSLFRRRRRRAHTHTHTLESTLANTCRTFAAK